MRKDITIPAELQPIYDRIFNNTEDKPQTVLQNYYAWTRFLTEGYNYIMAINANNIGRKYLSEWVWTVVHGINLTLFLPCGALVVQDIKPLNNETTNYVIHSNNSGSLNNLIATWSIEKKETAEENVTLEVYDLHNILLYSATLTTRPLFSVVYNTIDRTTTIYDNGISVKQIKWLDTSYIEYVSLTIYAECSLGTLLFFNFNATQI